MAVLSITLSPRPELYLSKDGRARLSVFIAGGVIIKWKLLNKWAREVARNRGAAVSKSQTGNKPQVASAARDVYQINYYGSDYCDSHTNPSLQMDPAAFTKPVADSIMGVAFKSPKVEEIGFSDRILQITSGNSTITTQEAANAVVAYGVWPDYNDACGAAVDKPTRPGPAVDRFYTLDSVQWSNSEIYLFPLPGSLTNLGMFGQNCFYHYLWSGGFAVHVQVNASKFHQGLLMVVAIPEAQNKGNDSPFSNYTQGADGINLAGNKYYPYQQLTIFPHQFINLRSNNSATVIVPFMNPNPMTSPLLHNPWTVCVIPIVPLQVEQGGAQTIPITVSVAPVSAQFNGLRMGVSVQGVPTFQIPGSGQFVTTVMNTGIPALPWFEQTSGHFIPGEITNLSQTIQVDSILATAPEQKGLNSLSFQVSNLFPVASQQSLLDIDMALTHKYFDGTYLSRCSKWFSQYRGSVRLTFLFTGSAMATGKLLLSYTPPGGDKPTTREQAMLATHVVWDVGLQSSCTLVVPWISNTQYRYQGIDTNANSYAGYISVFYQTAMVYPPGAPPNARVVVFAGACEDFEFRLLTDSAYFQGISDSVGKLVHGITQPLQPVDSTPGHGASVPEGLSIQSEQASALTAVETGASATTEPESNMEVQTTPVTFSKREMSIEAFLSKFSVLDVKVLRVTQGQAVDNRSWHKFPVGFNATTSLAVAAKYQMFTYVRANYDLVVTADVVNTMTAGQWGDGTDGKTLAAGQAGPLKYRMQLIFCPTGCPEPTSWNSTYWDLPTTPSVYFTTGSPPATLRVPFMGLGEAFASFYDGYGNFGRRQYGEFPGNQFGAFFVRVITPPGLQYTDSRREIVAAQIRVQLFLRPVNVRAWGPRPIVTEKTTVMVREGTQNRLVYVSHGREVAVPKGRRGGRRHTKRRQLDKIRNVPHRAPPPDVPNWMGALYILRPWKGPDSSYFYAIPHKGNLLMTAHQYCDELEVWMEWCKKWVLLEKALIYRNETRDVAIVHAKNLAVPEVDLLTDCRECKASATNDIAHYRSYFRDLECMWLHQQPVNVNGQVVARGPVYLVDCAIPFGYCGTPLHCKHGIRGLASAGTNIISLFCDLHLAVREWELGLVPRNEYITYHSVHPEFATHRMNPFSAAGEWICGSVSQIGRSFGSGLASELEIIADQFRGAKANLTRTVIQWLVKILGTMVLIATSHNRVETATVLGTMLGIDLLGTEPMEWLKEKVCQLMGRREAVVQGPSEWLKEFNAACNSLKGLEWIGTKLSEFLAWIKSKMAEEEPERRAFSALLAKLPDLLLKLDDPSLKVEQALKDLDDMYHGATKYGLKNNFLLNQMTRAREKLRARKVKAQTDRKEPIVLLISGPPGTGKSLVTNAIGTAIARYFGDEQGPYSLPPDPKYFDGYDGQKVVLMDDLGQNPDGLDMSLFCQMVSTTAFVPPKAELEDKGKPFTSDFILASTNSNFLNPPTIQDRKALERRFFLKCTIQLLPSYSTRDGRLDTTCIFDPSTYSGKATHFKPTPFTFGGLLLKDQYGVERNLEQTVETLISEYNRRQAVHDHYKAIFQGPKPRPCPREVIDMVRSLRDERIIQYAAQQGWLEDPRDAEPLVRTAIRDWSGTVLQILDLLTGLIAVGTTIWLAMKLFNTRSEGPYCGLPKPKPRQPQVRNAVVQGPDQAFFTRLFNTSLFKVETDTGSYTGLALFEKYLLLPKHSSPSETIELEGVTTEVEEVINLNNSHGNLELCMVRVKRPVNFRDIRKYIPEHFNPESSCTLLLNSRDFMRTQVPVGTVSHQGSMPLSGNPTYNLCRYRYPTKSGYCGGVVAKAGKIVAMHVGGDGFHGYGAILTKRILAVLEGKMEVVGPTPRPVNVNTKTKYRPSVFHDLFPGSKEPAALSNKDPRVEVDFERQIFSKHKGNTNFSITPSMRLAVEHYTQQLRAVVPSNLTEPMTLEEVVYGTTNLEPLDLTTSAGYPYITMGITKRDLIPPRGEPLTKLAQALLDHGTDLPYVTFLKDELRPIKKIKEGKTRIIEASSLNDTILMKQTFGRLFQTFHGNPGVSTGSAVGCDPDFHWSTFYHQLRENGGELLAFDYSNYDASLDTVWFECLKMVLANLGYGGRALEILDSICNSRHIYKNIEYAVEGGMPSGCSGTSIFNTMINNLIIRTLILDVYKGVDLDSLRVIAYGDDIIATYPFKLDAELIAQAGLSYNLTMTPPDKTSSFNETSWETVTFLKRRFVPDESYPYLVHPVYPMSEVYESIRWTKSPKHTREHIHSLCYLAWHNGRDIYNDFTKRIMSVPVGVACAPPSYDLLEASWYDLF